MCVSPAEDQHGVCLVCAIQEFPSILAFSSSSSSCSSFCFSCSSCLLPPAHPASSLLPSSSSSSFDLCSFSFFLSFRRPAGFCRANRVRCVRAGIAAGSNTHALIHRHDPPTHRQAHTHTTTRTQTRTRQHKHSFIHSQTLSHTHTYSHTYSLSLSLTNTYQ